jgi:hypothetical protein
MSRAGREPGFKKTNQDNCFAVRREEGRREEEEGVSAMRRL